MNDKPSLKRIFANKIGLTAFAAVLSVVNTALFHVPFFEYVCAHTGQGFNGVMIVVCLALIMLAANFLAFCLLLFPGRIVGRIIIAVLFICNAASLYFINTYDVMLDDSMMGNVLNTNTSEATSYWSPSALLYLLAMGVLPALYVLLRKVSFGTVKRFFVNVGAALAIIAAVAFANMPNWTWIDKNSTVIGSLILPWSYIVNIVRYKNHVRNSNQEEILLPDATIRGNDRRAVVLVIGESSRRDHFSLYGYGRETNPLLAAEEGLKVYPANSAATYTTAGVKAILSNSDSGELYEILPNYLFRAGVDVTWRTSNWGQPPLHIGKYQDVAALSEAYPDVDRNYDGLLVSGLSGTIASSDSDRVLIVLHTSTSHGPSYDRKYPKEFERFTPVCNTVEMSTCPPEQLINTYDNTIVYTDWLIDNVIEQLKSVEGWKCSMLFVSDHGESLGEGNLYMHGVPIKLAPAQQYEIPFLAWTSDPDVVFKDAELLSQYHVFHSILRLLDIESPVYNPDFDIVR